MRGKIKTDLKFYGVIALTLIFVIALGLLGKNYMSNKGKEIMYNENIGNDAIAASASCNVYNGTFTSCSGSCKFSGSIATCTAGSCVAYAKANSGYVFSGGSTTSSCSFSSYKGSSITASKTTTKSTTAKTTTTKASNNDINLTVGTNNSNGVDLSYSYLIGGKIITKSGSINTFKCNNKLSAGYSCSVIMQANLKNGYKLKGWSESSSCTNISYSGEKYNIVFSENDNKKMYACVERGTTTTGRTSSIQVAGNNSNATISCTGSGCSSAKGTSIKCAAGSSCNTTITGLNGYTVSLTSNCASSYKTRTHTISGGASIVYYVCAPATTTTTTKAPTKNNVPVVPETTVPVSNTENINRYVYAKGGEYSGNTISCGDKLYITTCTNDICNVTSINGQNVTSTSQIRKSNYVLNESETGCFQNIIRYISEKSYYFTNSGLTDGKAEINCGEQIVFTKPIDSACSGNSCEVSYNGKIIYVSKSIIVNDKPVCSNSDKCVTSNNVTDLKSSTNVKICKNDDTEEKRNKIVSCASDYELSYKLVTDTCANSNNSECYKEYKYTCNYIKRPGLSASAGVINGNGVGTINITGYDYGNVGLKGYYISSGDAPTQNTNWTSFTDSNYKAYENKTAGTYFVWSMNNKYRISNQVLSKVYDADLSTTLKSFSMTDSNGNSMQVKGIDNQSLSYNDTIIDGKYALLSNSLISDTDLSIFDSLTTAYEISTTSNKVALYATLTSDDANYVFGYEPRTIDLEYGRNVALIKIINNNGRERTYTFIINRVDDRDNSNLLKNIKLSKGKIDFDEYTNNYEVTIPKNTKVVSVNAELASNTSSFIKGYEPREVQITENIQSVLLKVKSESGSIRSYAITFIKNGADVLTSDSTYLSSLTVPGTQLGFDKDTYDYTITVPYDMEDIPIYAFAESESATVNISNNLGLKVGNNLIEIEVDNGSNSKIYSLHVIRKESGLDIANSARLGLLSIKNYNINFDPNVLDYTVKIKREKTLLITASTESNRADIYMYGNRELTGFSTIRVKVIAENGLTNIYSIDIEKAPYNKTVEILAVCIAMVTIITLSTYTIIRRKSKNKREYIEG